MPDTNDNPQFTESDLWKIMFALRDRYRYNAAEQAKCRRYGVNADVYDSNMADIAAVAEKLPDYMRAAWAAEVERIAAEVIA